MEQSAKNRADRNHTDIVHDIIDMQNKAEDELTCRFTRLEAEALIVLDDAEGIDLNWYARSIMAHLTSMKRAGTVLKLLPSRADCERTLEILRDKTED